MNNPYLPLYISYLYKRQVPFLPTGVFNKDPHEVFDFIIKLISQAKRRASGINLESIYRCLNRTVLYLLSRPADSIPAQMSILEALHKLTTHRYCDDCSSLLLLSPPALYLYYSCPSYHMSFIKVLFIVCLMCRTVVFGAGNHEPEFVACLTYCLLQLTADIKIK